jgi:hypothetical protein
VPDASPTIVALDRNGVRLDCAVKTCSGDGLGTLQRWLGDGKAEVLLLHNGKGKPLVLVNWDTWTRVARTIAPQQPDRSDQGDREALWPSWVQRKRQR